MKTIIVITIISSIFVMNCVGKKVEITPRAIYTDFRVDGYFNKITAFPSFFVFSNKP